MRLAIVVLALAASACAGKDGSSGTVGTASLIATDAEAPGANCVRGGTRVRIGVDANRDAVLDASEVSEIRYVCNGDGLSALVSIEDGGEGCAAGGFTIHWGLDADGDGALAESERTGSSPICQGLVVGVPGLIHIVEPVGAGDICTAGGFTMSSGHDANRDGILDPQEIERTFTICNGVDGLTSLVDQVQLKAGSEHCPNGGVLIRSGVDADRDGVLDDEEVDQENALCLPCKNPGSSNCTSGKLVSVAHVNAAIRTGGMAVGDVDGDGHQDVVISRYDSNPALYVWRGRGDGSFYGAPTQAGSGIGFGGSIRLADFDGDRHLDLVGCGPTGGFAILPGHGDGTFGDAMRIPRGGGFCRGLETLDFDGDGVIDLMVATSEGVALLEGAGDGTFSQGPTFPPSDSQEPTGITAGDLNGDGHPDIVWAESHFLIPNPGVYVALNAGDGTFSEPVLAFRPGGCCVVELGDFNGDGQLDVLVGSGGEQRPWQFELRLGDGQGGFGAPSLRPFSSQVGEMALGDFDGDGNLDVVTTQNLTTMIYRGNGDGTLNAPTFTINAGGAYLSLGDFNDDGKHDVVVHHFNVQKVEILIGD